MPDRRQWERSGWGGRIAVILAITTVLLFANTITVAPAVHDHDHGHDHLEHSHNCLVCTIATHGVWSPASAPDVRVVCYTESAATVLERDDPHPAFVRLQPVRGPPTHA